MALQSIQKQLINMRRDPPPGCVAEPTDNDPFQWVGHIMGPSETPYSGGVFSIAITFPTDYPFKPPRVSFTTRIYHPYINDNGFICCNILGDAWCPALNIANVLLSVQSLLSDFDALEDAIRPDAAQLYRQDKGEFERTARAWTKMYAM